MACRPRGSWFIMANKTDLEYIMFPVNLIPRHQRPGNKKKVSRVSEQMSAKKKKGDLRFESETNQPEWSVGAKVSRKTKVKRTLICSCVCLQGSPGPPGPAGPIGSAGVRVSSRRLALMATMPSEFLQHEQYRFSFSVFMLYSRALQERKDRLDPEAPQGPW